MLPHSPTHGQKCAITRIIALLFVGLLPIAAGPQEAGPFEGQSEIFHADLTRYYPTPQVESTSRLLLQDRTDAFLKTGPWEARNVSASLDKGAELLTEWMRHHVYCNAMYARDVNDAAARACDDQAENEFDALLSFAGKQLQQETIASLTDSQLSNLGLAPYRYLIEQSRSAFRHTPSPDAQKLEDALVEPLRNGLVDRHDHIIRTLKAVPIQTKSGGVDPLKDTAKIEANPDRSIREAGFVAQQQAYTQHGEVLAATLIDIARIENRVAKLHGYADAPEWKYSKRLELTEPQVRTTLDAMTNHADVLKHYQQMRASQVTRVTGIQDVHSWDMELSSGYAPKPLSFDQARALILEALRPLGPAYVSQFEWLLDPKNGALDLTGGQHRQKGGFSLGFPGVPVMLYVANFDGTVPSVAVVIHEGGHAIHRRLMGEAKVSPYYATGPKSLNEAYAIFNELLLWDELERESKTPAEAAYYQERFLDKLTFEVFTSAEEASFEQGLYDGVSSGLINSQADLDNLNQHILDKYELFAEEEPSLRYGWMRKRLLYEDPLYLVNYLYAALVACKFYQMDKANALDFQRRYLTLLREGFNAPAADLIQKTMGFSLERDQLLDGALNLIQDQTTRLDNTYESLAGPAGQLR